MPSLPEPYQRLFDYASYQNANPTRPLPGSRVNIDLNDVERAIGEIIGSLNVIALQQEIELSDTIDFTGKTLVGGTYTAVESLLVGTSTAADTSPNTAGSRLTVYANSTSALIPAGAAAGYGIWSGDAAQFTHGSIASPITSGFIPSLSVHRVENINSVISDGSDAPAIIGQTLAYGAQQGVAVAGRGFKMAGATGDIVGLYGVGAHYGTSGYAFGAFFQALATTAGTNAFAIETVTNNNTGTNDPYSYGGTPRFVGADLTYAGNSTNYGGVAIWIRQANPGAVTSDIWDVGVLFQPHHVRTASIQDDSSSAHILRATGSHTNGINLSGATFSGNAFLSPGFSVSPLGAVSSDIYVQAPIWRFIDSGNDNVLSVSLGENLTANRTLVYTVGDANRSIALGGNLAFAANFTTSGANALTLTTTGATNVTLPTTGTLATRAGAETFTNKSLTSPTLTGTVTGPIGDWTTAGINAQSGFLQGATLRLIDTGADHVLSATVGENLSANRALSIIVNNADRTINLAGNLTLAAAFATSGANSLTLTTTGSTNVTLPTTGTLVTLAGAEELTSKTLNASVGKGMWTASGTWTLPALTLGGAITYGGVTLSNSVTGTGSMVLSTNANLTTPNIGAATGTSLVVSGNVSSAGAVLTGGFTTTGFWDASAVSQAIANGANGALGISNGMIVLHDASVTGDMSLWMISGATASLVSTSGGGLWVASTTTPAAGKASVAWSGSALRIYNNQGAQITVRALQFKTN